MQLLDSLLVVAEIFLAADEDDGEALAEVEDFGDPLFVTKNVSINISILFTVTK